MELLKEYDVAIVGGGLAGLAASIQLRRKGHSVILFEKETYPFHKVCGEYISLESRGFLESLGVPLAQWRLPVIDTLLLTAPNGKSVTTPLPLGGFGVSRHRLDNALSRLARQAGVHLLEGTKADRVETGGLFTIGFAGQSIKAKVCCAAWGKRSNLDIKWGRPFLKQQNSRLNNYVGIKYHIKISRQENLIGLHNFKNGYCGLSKIEGDNYCLCYMTSAANLKSCHNSIALMQETILSQNPHLKKIFSESEVLPGFPVTISGISFSRKAKAENGVLMLGDAAGMITPLCGNGMSIALHTSKIASGLIEDFLKEKITRVQLEKAYDKQWKKQFARRLAIGRALQAFFGSTRLSNLFVGIFKAAPFLAKPLIRQTHGNAF